MRLYGPGGWWYWNVWCCIGLCAAAEWKRVSRWPIILRGVWELAGGLRGEPGLCHRGSASQSESSVWSECGRRDAGRHTGRCCENLHGWMSQTLSGATASADASCEEESSSTRKIDFYLPRSESFVLREISENIVCALLILSTLKSATSTNEIKVSDILQVYFLFLHAAGMVANMWPWTTKPDIKVFKKVLRLLMIFMCGLLGLDDSWLRYNYWKSEIWWCK